MGTESKSEYSEEFRRGVLARCNAILDNTDKRVAKAREQVAYALCMAALDHLESPNASLKETEVSISMVRILDSVARENGIPVPGPSAAWDFVSRFLVDPRVDDSPHSAIVRLAESVGLGCSEACVRSQDVLFIGRASNVMQKFGAL